MMSEYLTGGAINFGQVELMNHIDASIEIMNYDSNAVNISSVLENTGDPMFLLTDGLDMELLHLNQILSYSLFSLE